MTCVWAIFSLAAGLAGAWFGLGGHALASALGAGSFFLFIMLLCASRGVVQGILTRLGGASGILLGVAVFCAYLIYILGTNTFAMSRVAAGLALIFVPLAMAASAERKPAGAWQDFAVIAAVWVAVKFLPSGWPWPYPKAQSAHAFTVLMMVNVGIAVFLLTRQIEGVGYCWGWGPHWLLYVSGSFLCLAAVAVPGGLALHFLRWAPHWAAITSLPVLLIGIFLFTAWPEEFLFRGLLQNCLTRASGSDAAGWCAASLLFGLSHLSNGHFPNWRYALLASLAGFF